RCRPGRAAGRHAWSGGWRCAALAARRRSGGPCILGRGAGRVRACARNVALRRCPAAYRGCARDRHGERGGRVRAIALTALWWWLLAACAQAGAAPPVAPPQLPMPRQISVYDGLPSNRINALAEDRQGYLWIGTRDGLARYDGVGYRVWRVGDGL